MARMSKEQIAFLLRRWIQDGVIVTKRSTGLPAGQINKKFAEREYFASVFKSIVVQDERVRDELEALIAQHRVLDINACRIHTNLLTLYQVNIAAANGEIIRIPDLGGKVTLYVAD